MYFLYVRNCVKYPGIAVFGNCDTLAFKSVYECLRLRLSNIAVTAYPSVHDCQLSAINFAIFKGYYIDNGKYLVREENRCVSNKPSSAKWHKRRPRAILQPSLSELLKSFIKNFGAL